MSTQESIKVDRNGTAHTGPMNGHVPAFFFRYGQHSRVFAGGPDGGDLAEEHRVVLPENGRFTEGVILKPDEEGKGVWLIDPTSQELGMTEEDKLYFMSMGGQVINMANGATVADGDGRFQFDPTVIERYEAEQTTSVR